MTFNAADRKSIRQAEKASAAINRQRVEVVCNIMAATPGRAYIWGELSACHVFATSFASDPLQMAFLEGERNAGLRLLNDIMEACPEEFILMMREAQIKEPKQDFQQEGFEDEDQNI